jgi:hypothetical protein
MPRIRTIRPDAFRSLSLAAVPVEARWLFAGLWTEADDAGIVRDHAGLIRSALFPLDGFSDEQIDEWLQQLADVGSVCRYDVGGHRFLHMPGWSHQKINRPTPSTLPGCPKCRPGLRVVETDPGLLGEVVIADPRRCPEHQTGRYVRCGACKDARIAHDEAQKSKPTLSAKTTMCGEHPEHPARACPVCAAQVVPAPAEFRRGRKKSTS